MLSSTSVENVLTQEPLAMLAVWHALGTGDEAALDGYDAERLKAESLRIVGELPELFRGVDSSRLRGEGPPR